MNLNSSNLRGPRARSEDLFSCSSAEEYDDQDSANEDSETQETPEQVTTQKRQRRSSGFVDYESPCGSYLSGQPIRISPLGAHLDGRWGKNAKNWSLWTVWDTSLLAYPFFSVNVAEHQGPGSNFEREELRTVVNEAFDKTRLEEKGWRPLAKDNFIVLRVNPQDIEEKYFPYTEEITLAAHQILYQGPSYEPASTSSSSFPVKFQAFSGLAEIFKAAICQSDLLIVSGGHGLLRVEENRSILYGLNFDKARHTQIIRIPGKLHGRLTLYEKIEPRLEEKRYKFTYMVKRGSMQRVVEQHRIFDSKTFCRKISDTLAYSRMRWDFPVPIVRETSPHSIFELLSSKNFKMPPPPKPVWYDDNDKEDDDSETQVPLYKSDSPKVEQMRFELFSRTKRMSGEMPRQTRPETQYTTNNDRSGFSKRQRPRRPSNCGCLSTTCVVVFTIMASIIALIWLASFFQQDCPVRREASQSPDQSHFLLDSKSHKPSSDNNAITEQIYSWMAQQTEVVKHWLDIAIRWVSENCNLECILAKMGFKFYYEHPI